MEDREQKFTNIITCIFLSLVLLGGIVCILTFSRGIEGYDIYDYAEGVEWAAATLRSASIVNPGFTYSYVIPFGPNLIMAPFVRIFGISYTANRAGMLVYYFIYLYVLFRLASELYDNIRCRALFCGLLSMFVFTYAGDNLLHHILGYGIAFVCFLGELSCILSILNRHRIRRSYILLGVLALWSASNGLFPTVLSSLSVCTALLMVHWLKPASYPTGSAPGSERKTDSGRKQTLNTLAALIIPTVIGILVYRHYNSMAANLNRYDERFFLDTAKNMAQKLSGGILGDYLRIFWYNPDNTYIFSRTGILLLLRLVFALSVFLLPIVLLLKYRSSLSPVIKRDDRSLVLISSCIVMTVCFGQYVLVTTSVHRYLFNGVLALFCIGAMLSTDLLCNGSPDIHSRQDKGARISPSPAFVVIPALLLSAAFLYHSVHSDIPRGRKLEGWYRSVAGILKEEGLTTGYCFTRSWDPLYLLSDGEITTLQIRHDKKNNRYYVVRDRVYDEQMMQPEDTDRFYIIVNKNDGTESERSSQTMDLLAECTQKRELEGAVLYIFNISDWDRLFMIWGA